MNEQQQSNFNGYARVEVMGHQTHIGYVRTEAYGQAVMFRIDTPELPEREYTLKEPEYVTVTLADNLSRSHWAPAGTVVKRLARPAVSVLVGAGSIYRIIPCTEEAALRAIDETTRPKLILVALPEGKALEAPRDEPEDEREDKDNDPDEDYFEK